MHANHHHSSNHEMLVQNRNDSSSVINKNPPFGSSIYDASPTVSHTHGSYVEHSVHSGFNSSHEVHPCEHPEEMKSKHHHHHHGTHHHGKHHSRKTAPEMDSEIETVDESHHHKHNKKKDPFAEFPLLQQQQQNTNARELYLRKEAGMALQHGLVEHHSNRNAMFHVATKNYDEEVLRQKEEEDRLEAEKERLRIQQEEKAAHEAQVAGFKKKALGEEEVEHHEHFVPVHHIHRHARGQCSIL